MGLASSQARMLLLTARKSDLEYRAQMISQRKIDLSMQTEEIANKYSQATSNRKMYLVNGVLSGENYSSDEKLTYAGLMATNNDATTGNFLIRIANDGRFLVTGRNEETQKAYAYKIAERLARTQEGGLNNYIEPDGSLNYETLLAAYEKYMYYDGSDGKSSTMVTAPAFTNADLFQEAIRSGSLYLYKADVPAGQTTDSAMTVQFKNTAWSSISSIQDKYYTEDDAAAKADYEAKTLTLSNQDKMLDLELNKIQTQHKAIETEYDSVKKVIEKNIETSYKIFA